MDKSWLQVVIVTTGETPAMLQGRAVGWGISLLMVKISVPPAESYSVHPSLLYFERPNGTASKRGSFNLVE